MENDFDNAQTKALNKLWRYLPSWFQHIILWAGILGAVCSAVWGAIKFVPDAMEWVKTKRAEQGKMDFIAQQVWTETQSNLKTLDRFWAEKDKLAFRKKAAHFIYDSYSRYAGQLGAETSQQVDNFYKNLKRIENGEPYTNEEVVKVKGQGADILNFLKRDFGLHDYFENNQGIRIASASGKAVLRPNNIVSADTAVVSADLPVLTKPPYGSIGEDISKGKDGESR